RISEELQADLGDSGHRAVLAVPLRVKAVVIGALGVIDDAGRRFDAEEARLLQAFADQAALALENARLFSLERARRRQIAALAEIEREFAAELDNERLLGLIVAPSACAASASSARPGSSTPRAPSTCWTTGGASCGGRGRPRAQGWCERC